MPYLDHQPEDTWRKRLFDKLKNVEDKLDRLLEGGTKDCLQLGLGRENPLSQSQWTIAFPSGRDR